MLNSWTLAILLINCEINVLLTWSTNFTIANGTAANQVPTFARTSTKLYDSIETLSTQNDAKLLQ